MSASPRSRQLRFVQLLHLPPKWTVAIAFAAACAAAGWQIVAGGTASAPTAVPRALLWPGLAVFFAVYLFAWLGWALDLG